MLCIVEIACLVFGIMTLVKGVVPVSSTKEVRGAPAYVIGLLLLAVFPLALCTGIVIGIQQAQQGGPAPAGFDLSLIWIDLAAVGVGVIPSIIIALVAAKPKLKKKKKVRDDDEQDYDDYERGRYREDDDEPRRRRDDDYDDDEPRRRRDDDDDYDDGRRRR